MLIYAHVARQRHISIYCVLVLQLKLVNCFAFVGEVVRMVLEVIHQHENFAKSEVYGMFHVVLVVLKHLYELLTKSC